MLLIVYKNIMQQLHDAGWSSYRLRHEKVLSEDTMQKIRTNGVLKTSSLDRICRILDCQLNDIAAYIPDEEQGK